MRDPANLLAPPAGAVPFTLVVLGLIVAVPIYFIVRFLRAYERRAEGARDAQSQAATIAALEDEVVTLRADVERLTSAHDFTMQLLQARPLDESDAVRESPTARDDGERNS